jgi:hypothetical protein
LLQKSDTTTSQGVGFVMGLGLFDGDQTNRRSNARSRKSAPIRICRKLIDSRFGEASVTQAPVASLNGGSNRLYEKKAADLSIHRPIFASAWRY